MVDFQRNVFCLLGLPFDAVDSFGAVQRVRNAAEQGTRCFVSTPNVNWVVSCLTDDAFRDSAIHSDLSVADGMPLVWMARLLDIPIRERVAGSTLFDLLRSSSEKQLAVYFFGGADGAAEAACRRLRIENKGLTCVGFESPGFGSIEQMGSDAVIQRMNSSKADFLVVALGARKGQAWIERNRARISVPLVSHLGAVVNFVAGTVKRAPACVGRMGLEWLWRIKEEPALWIRYYRDGLALIALLVTRVLPYAWYLHNNKPAAESLAAAKVEARDEQDEYVISLSGVWTRRNIDPLRDCFAKAVLAEKGIRLALGEVTYVDSSFIGLAILLQGHQNEQCRSFRIVAPREAVRRVIRYCCADYLLSRPLSSPPGTPLAPSFSTGIPTQSAVR